jgi:CelD/BcsL family acetyltransferase involved in cellulose biosynthesis
MPAAAAKRPPFDAEQNASAPPQGSGETVEIRVFTSIEQAEPLWRALEAYAVLTPYQHCDWIRGIVASRDTPTTLAIVVLMQGSKPLALLPLEVASRYGARTAQVVGAEVGNTDWIAVRRDAASLLTRERILDMLGAASDATGGIDLLALHGLPQSWRGIANPLLAFPHQPGPDHLYMGTLQPNGGFSRLDEQRTSNLLRRKRKLGNAHGEVKLRRAEDAAEVDEFHRAFLEQRGARFAQMGIPNIFAEPHFVKLFRDGAIASLGEPQPAFVFHALFAGESIVATAFGSFGGDHYTQYINATAGGDVAKFRLISLLMYEVFADVAASGATTVDMGLGDFDYKNDWTVPETAYDSIIPLTLRGRAVGGAILSARRVKRAIKQHDRLWALARKLRAALGRSKRQQKSG